jgi:hypothetical protein
LEAISCPPQASAVPLPRRLARSSQPTRIEQQLEALHVGRDHHRRAAVLGELAERLVDLVLQVLGGQRRIDDTVRLRDALGTRKLDLGILGRNLDLDTSIAHAPMRPRHGG